MHAKTTKGMSEDWGYYFQHLYPYPTEGAPNGKWGDDTHPSDNKLGYSDVFKKAIPPSGFHGNANANFQNLSPDEVHQDDMENWGHGPTQEAGPGVATPAQNYTNYIVITPQPKVIRDRVVEQAATDSLIGYSKCQIIGVCDQRHPEVLGSPCMSGRQQKGFCNYDAEGDWLCMRTALWWSYGAQYATDTEHKHDIRENVGYQSSSPNGQPTACTPGTKATTDLSGEWQPRLLIGGCMDKGANNFNAAARQPGKCKYSNTGCTDALSLNYNSEATDDDGSCIKGTCGCNMGDPIQPGGAYSTHDPSTDKYQKLSVGVPTPNGGSEVAAGKVVYTEYSAVMEDFTTSPAYYASGVTPTKAAGTTATVLGGPTCGN